MRSILDLHLQARNPYIHLSDLSRELEISRLINLINMDLITTAYLIKIFLWILVRIAHKEAVHELLHKVVIEAKV